MSLFRRRSAPARLPLAPGPGPGPAQWDLEAEAVAAFARGGVDTIPDGEGNLRTPDGGVFGLHNLAVILDRAPREHWRDLVDEHARTMIASQQDALPTSIDEVRDILYPRIHDTGAGGGAWPAEALATARELAPGLHVLAALDLPHVVSTLTDLDALGGWDSVWPVAMANLRRLPPPEHRVTEIEATPSARVHIFHTEDYFGATRLLDLDHLLHAAGVEPLTHGALVVLPNRHTLAVHLVTSPAMVTAAGSMLTFARTHAAGAGPLSPHLYFRTMDGRLEQISEPAPRPDGTVQLTAVGAFGQALSDLGSIDDGDD